MPTIEKKDRSSLTGVLDDVVEKRRKSKYTLATSGDEYDPEFLNILEFIERFNLLPSGLYPAQKFILKLCYNLPLDNILPENETDQIKISPTFQKKDSFFLTETEYLTYLHKNGRCNIGIQDNHPRRELILVLGRRSGKCSDLETKVMTDEGILSLSELLNIYGSKRIENSWTNASFLVSQEKGKQAFSSALYYGGKQKIRKIITNCGYQQSSTLPHRIKVLDEFGSIIWKYFKDLSPGDFIGINRSCGLWAKNLLNISYLKFPKISNKFSDFVDSKLGEFLGILVGDGTWSAGTVMGRIQVTGGCEEFRIYIEKLFNHYFGSFHLSRKKSKRTTLEKGPWSITKGSVPNRIFLNNLGYRLDVTKSTKSIPWVIFRSPKPVVAAFLRGLFETDGGLEQDGRTISFSTASKQLASEVQLLLLNFGITASIYDKWNKKYERYYHVIRIIGYESRKIFSKEIRFITQRKNTLLDRGSCFGRDASNIIPNQQKHLRNLLNSIPKSKNKGDDLRTKISKCFTASLNSKTNSDISYDSLRKLVSLLEKINHQSLEHFKNLLTLNYFWDPVSYIGESEGEVGDVYVPGNHQYTAQGFINHNSSAEKVYKAISPSLKQFSPRDHKDRRKPLGPSEGRMISISSPDAREGLFYKLYEMSLSNTPASSNMLMVQAPTWEVNPTIDENEYIVERAKSPRDFDTEYGAKFSDRVRGWIESATDLTDCVVSSLIPLQRGLPREPFFCGLDFALVGDGTSVVLTHINNGKIELGYHETWRAGTSWKELNPHLIVPSTPYAGTISTVNRLDLDEIINWLVSLSKRFYILKGYFDQWAGIIFEQKLHKAGLLQLEMKNFTSSESSQMFQATKMLMFSHQLALYDYPLPEKNLEAGVKNHSSHIQELLELQATSGGKNIVLVEAPKIIGKHDDFSDAYVRSNYAASEYVRSNPNILDINLSMPVRFQPVNYFQIQRAKIRMHGLPPRERRVPAMNRWR